MTFTVGEYDEPHSAGDAECGIGWCSGSGWSYPHPCEREGCSGLVHAEFGDEDWDCNYWLYTKCDVCGESQ